MLSLDDKLFEKFSKLIYDNFGITLRIEKKEMLQSRLRKLALRHNFDSFDDYFSFLVNGARKEDWIDFANEITINKTNFFRENNHFNFIRSNADSIIISDRVRRNREIRIWSAGCSTGEEAYTLGMILSECIPKEINIKILATDISNKVLKVAISGVYPDIAKQDIEPYYITKYFDLEKGFIKVKENLKSLVTFRAFNLMDPFPFKNPFDIIFCRNVMIYFDLKTQQELVEKFYNTLLPSGLLFIGHSESLLDRSRKFQYVQPTIYKK